MPSTDTPVAAAPRPKHTLRFRILTLVAALNVAGTIAACAMAYHSQKEAFVRGIDRVLTTGAIGAQHIYGDRFQQELLNGKKYTPSEELAHIQRISDLTERLDLNYIGAVVRRDGKYFYTISSSPEYELQNGSYDRIWTEYPDATRALASTFEDGQTRFECHSDAWGEFRSAYIAFELPGGEKIDYVYVADIDLTYIYSHLHRTLAKTAAAGLVISLVGMGLTWLLAKHLASPLMKLVQVICSVTMKDCQLADAQRTTLDAISAEGYREVGEVSAAFVRMEGRLRDYIAELEHTAAERQRIASELGIAREIQNGLLPRTLPQLPGCDVFARVIPAKEVGGDLFDVTQLPDGRLLLVVADVSGKGVSAGMFMAVAKTLLDVASANCTKPDEIARFLNDRLSAENEACMFVTMFIGIFDPTTGWLHYTNAGHNPPYIRRQDGKLDSLTERHGMALGIMGGQTFKSDVVKLGQGELLLLYSDGITEAQDASESLFTEGRLETCLHEIESGTAGEAAAKVIECVREFQGAAPQFDDITLVTLRYAAAVAPQTQPTPSLAAPVA